MFCPKCGAQLPEGSIFCGKCGMRLPNRGTAGTADGAGAEAAPSYRADTGAADVSGENTAGPAGGSGQSGSGDDGGSGSGKRIAAILGIAAAAVILIVGINLVLSGTISFQSAEERWQEQYDLGQRYLLEQDYEQAIVAFTEAIELEPNYAEAYIGRAEAYLGFDTETAAEENLYLALADYDTALELDDTQAQIYTDRGDVHLALGSDEENLTAALSDYAAALELDDTLVELFIREAEIYVALGDHEGAATAYTNAIEGDLKTAEVYLGRAESYCVLGNAMMEEDSAEGEPPQEAADYLKEALSDYRTVLGLGDAAVDTYRAAAEICLLLEDYEKAEEILEEGLAAYSGDGQLQELLEEAQNLLSGQYKAAAYPAYYRKLMELQAEYGEATLAEVGYNGESYGFYSISGLFLARLVDFDADGTEELLLAYREYPGYVTSSSVVGGYVAQADCSVEVWHYEDGGIEMVYEGQGYTINGNVTSLWLLHAEDRYYLMEGWGDGSSCRYIYGYKDGIFVQVKALMEGDMEDAYYIDDEQVTREEYETEDDFWFGDSVYYLESFYSESYYDYDPRPVLEETMTVLEVYADGGTDAAVSVSAQIPQDAVMFGGHHYCLFDSGFTEEEALELCESIGGYLAVITSEEENAFLFDYIISLDCTSAYFGLTDREEESVWVWVNGEEVVYTNWHSGEPNSENENEDYAMFYWKYTDGTWNDGDWGGKTNSGGTAFLCEWDA